MLWRIQVQKVIRGSFKVYSFSVFLTIQRNTYKPKISWNEIPPPVVNVPILQAVYTRKQQGLRTCNSLPGFIKPKNRTVNPSCLLHLPNIDLSCLSIFNCHLFPLSLFTFSLLLPASLISFQKMIHTNLTPTGASDLSKLTACGLSTDGNW